jgi:hypothetical protein
MANLLCRFRPALQLRERSLGRPSRGKWLLRGRKRMLAALSLAGLMCGTNPAPSLAAPLSLATAFERDLDARLARAARAGNRSELMRLGARAGARGLRPILIAEDPGVAPPERPARLAAVLAAPAAEDAWDLLSALAVHAAGPDRLLAASAAASAALIATRLHRDWYAVSDQQEIAPATLAEAQQSWLELVADSGRWVDVRVLALETSVSLGRVLHAFAGDVRTETSRGPAREPAGVLAELTAHPEPALRRAAFELLAAPLTVEQRTAAARAVADDPDPDVALAAAQALCSGLAFGDAPAPILAVLREPARARLRTLITAPAHLPAARIDAARCLAAAGDARSRRALGALPASLPPDLRGLAPRAQGRGRGRGRR